MPKKAYYRARAHVNPLSHNNAFAYPATPGDVDWAVFFPPSGAAAASAAAAAGGREGGGAAPEAGVAAAVSEAAAAANAVACRPTIVDVGCGFGGLTVALALLFPQERSLGMEIRAKVGLQSIPGVACRFTANRKTLRAFTRQTAHQTVNLGMRVRAPADRGAADVSRRLVHQRRRAPHQLHAVRGGPLPLARP
jgi:hypothetical protein